MARQYKLRLRDGTILAVDQAGLRTWLIDDRAMVQPMGTRGWQPLREVLAQASLAAAISPPPPPRPQTLADEEIPAMPIKPLSLGTPTLPGNVADRPVNAMVPERMVEPAPTPPPPIRPVPAPMPAAAAVAAPAVAPARPAPPRPAASSAPVAVAPVPVAPVAVAAVAATPVPVAARPAVAPAAPAPLSARVAPPPPRPARPLAPPQVSTPLIPEPEPLDAPPTIADLPIIPFKRMDDEPAGPRVSVRVAPLVETREETDLADALALVIQKEVAQGNAVVISEDELEELDLVEDERVEPAPPLPPKEAFEAEVSRSVNQLVGWARSAMAAAVAKASAVRAEASAPRPQPAQPPPALSELPVLSFAAADKPASSRRRVIWAGLAAAVVLAAVAGAIVVWRSNAGDAVATAVAPAPTPVPDATAPALPNDVAVAAERLPHLAPETVQLLISTSSFGSPDPSELFRRARLALRRGVAALTPEEGQELAVLERAVLVRLSPAERERVMAYDRMRAGRELVPAEDARVLSLFARGARGLQSAHRDRLQALSGKAIAAALASP